MFLFFFFVREHFLGNQTEVNSYLLAIFQMRNRELGLGAASGDHFPPFLLSFRFRASSSSQANFVCVIVTVSGFAYGPMHLYSGFMGPMPRLNLEGADVNPKTNVMLTKLKAVLDWYTRNQPKDLQSYQSNW